MSRIKLLQLIKEVAAERQNLNEGPLASLILKTAKDAIASGSEVTVMGKPIMKIVVPAGALFPTDGGPSIRIGNLDNALEDIMVDGEPIESIIQFPEPTPKPIDIRTPEEKAAAAQAWQDRWGPGGGVDTFMGRYTGD